MRQSTVPSFSPCLKQDPERECLESIVLFREGTYRSFQFPYAWIRDPRSHRQLCD